MTLRALIIDDEPLAHDIIDDYAREVPFLEIAGHAYLATEALGMLRNQPVDLIFLDIQMPKLKGLDFLRLLPDPPLVIVTSAYDEYALESYELEVCDYLLKPFRLDRFLKAVQKAREWHRLRRGAPDIPSAAASASAPGGCLFIKSDKRHIQLVLTEIDYLESYGNYVKVWLGDDYHLTPRTLSSFEMQLPAGAFFRVHKSYIVNRSHIDYLEGNTIVLKSGRELPLGKNYRQAFRDFIADN